MRPIDRGPEPQKYTNYEDAKQDLTNRLGCYCSYCERRIATNLAIEHILPKDESLPYSHLRNEWSNFLLACVNCNSVKSTTIIEFDKYLLPDRDNTFGVYVYSELGEVEVRNDLDVFVRTMAQNTLDLVGLNRLDHPNWDINNLQSALGRLGQRTQAWVQAKDARMDFDNSEVNIKSICREATSLGFFSIYMTAFVGVKEVRQGLIKAFSNTASDCFDANGNCVSPRPNNGLQNAGKS